MPSRLVRVAALVAGLSCLAACGGSAPHGSGAPRPATTVTRGAVLPYQPEADVAACAADATTLKLAEQSYQLLNGSFATMDQLVSDQLLARPSAYFTAVEVGHPASGYTLVGGDLCVNVVVVGEAGGSTT
jgi:hypothetical protein